MQNQTPCEPCLKLNGKLPAISTAMKIAREILEERDGPPPGPKSICRHTCKNDSMAPNGFVCSEHTVWGTYYENKMDQSPEARAAGGKISGLAHVASGHWAKISTAASRSKGGKANAASGHCARIAAMGGKSPNAGGNLPRTCIHCGRTMNAANHARWHGDNCSSR